MYDVGMDSIRRAAAFLFYCFGALLIAVVILVRQDMMPESLMPYVSSLDLPVLFIAMVFGGSSLYVSLTKGRSSPVLFVVIALPLILLFGLFCWMNFALPLSEV